MTFVYYPLLSQTQAQYTYDGIREWFKNNPGRNECQCEGFTVRRDHIKEDILKESVPNTFLSEIPENDDFSKSLPKSNKKKKLVKKHRK